MNFNYFSYLFTWIIEKWTTRDRTKVTKLSNGHVVLVKYLTGRIVYVSDTTLSGQITEVFYDDANHPDMITKSTCFTKDGELSDVVFYNNIEDPTTPSKTISYFDGEIIEETYLSDGTVERSTETNSWKIVQHLNAHETVLMEKTLYKTGISVQCWYDIDYTFTLFNFPTGAIKEVEELKNLGVKKEIEISDGLRIESMTYPDGLKRKYVFDNGKLIHATVRDSYGNLTDVFNSPSFKLNQLK